MNCFKFGIKLFSEFLATVLIGHVQRVPCVLIQSHYKQLLASLTPNTITKSKLTDELTQIFVTLISLYFIITASPPQAVLRTFNLIRLFSVVSIQF